MDVSSPGIFRDSETYTLEEVARRLEITVAVAERELIHAEGGVRYRKRGRKYLISGRDVRFWVENGGEFYRPLEE